METKQKQRRKAQVDRDLCVGCGCCEKVCPLQAVRVVYGIWAQVDAGKCVGCGRCVKECPASVIVLEEAAV